MIYIGQLVIAMLSLLLIPSAVMAQTAYDPTCTMLVMPVHPEDIDHVVFKVSKTTGGPYQEHANVGADFESTCEEVGAVPLTEIRSIPYRMMGTHNGNPQLPTELSIVYKGNPTLTKYFAVVEVFLAAGGSVQSDEMVFLIDPILPPIIP